MGRLLTGLFIIGIACTGYGAEIDYETIVRNMIATLDANRSTWAYRIEVTDSESTRVIEHDPAQTPRWRLISVNGNAPSEKQLREHYKRWVEDDADSTGQEVGKEYSLDDVIDLNSLALQDETEEHYVVSFQPVIRDLKAESRKLNGRLYIDKESKVVDFMSITNQKSLSPAFSVSIDDFNLYFSFITVKDTIFPSKVRTDIEGTALFFKSFERHSSQEYSDFRYVGTD